MLTFGSAPLKFRIKTETAKFSVSRLPMASFRVHSARVPMGDDHDEPGADWPAKMVDRDPEDHDEPDLAAELHALILRISDHDSRNCSTEHKTPVLFRQLLPGLGKVSGIYLRERLHICNYEAVYDNKFDNTPPPRHCSRSWGLGPGASRTGYRSKAEALAECIEFLWTRWTIHRTGGHAGEEAIFLYWGC